MPKFQLLKNPLSWVFISCVLLVTFILILMLWKNKSSIYVSGTIPYIPDRRPNKFPTVSSSTQYSGLVAFDEDGTLIPSSLDSNNEAVQMALDRGMAVAIITAGGYDLDDFKDEHTRKVIMKVPDNLYNFIKVHNYEFFNSVGSKMIVMGQKIDKFPTDVTSSGAKKAYAMEQMMKKYNINSQCCVLFDDSEDYLEGVSTYKDYNFPVQCAGKGCSQSKKFGAQVCSDSNCKLNLNIVGYKLSTMKNCCK